MIGTETNLRCDETGASDDIPNTVYYLSRVQSDIDDSDFNGVEIPPHTTTNRDARYQRTCRALAARFRLFSSRPDPDFRSLDWSLPSLLASFDFRRDKELRRASNGMIRL